MLCDIWLANVANVVVQRTSVVTTSFRVTTQVAVSSSIRSVTVTITVEICRTNRIAVSDFAC